VKILIEDDGILFYQVGRVITQNALLIHCLTDPMSIYMNKESCNAMDS